MGILLTTTTKQGTPLDPFAMEVFGKKIIQTPMDVSKNSAAKEDLPYPAYLCMVYIDSKMVGLFQSISELEVKREVEKVVQGGENDFHRTLPRELSFGHITLKSGYTTSTLFFEWMLAGQHDARPIYKNIELVHKKPPLGPDEKSRQWTFHQALPIKWKISGFSVDDTEKIAIEEIEFSYLYFTVQDISAAK